MAIDRSVGRASVRLSELHFDRVAELGLDSHPHLRAVVNGTGRTSGRDFADAVHLLCALHGSHPGLIELAHSRSPEVPARAWLAGPAEAFEQERLYLVQLTAAVGPIPSTPGAAETEASLALQRNALEILSVSERRGCAIGAAFALLADWRAIRRLLDRAADRVGVDAAPSTLPDQTMLADLVERAGDSVASQRALAFGAEQLLLQHRALFDLLEARASARTGY